ncbi:20013_t:CDS:2, partial [Cetraspora pellucida]
PIYPQYTPPNSDDMRRMKTSQNKSVISCKSLVAESKQNKKVTMPNLFSESDNQLLELLSPAMRKKIIDPSTKNKWVESLEYMQCRIEDIIIPDVFVDTASECLGINKVLNEAVGWNLGMAPNFFLRHNSDHIMKLEEGHKDVPISIKYKNKWVTETGHVVVIDDGKPDYLLCLETPWIRKPIKNNVLSSLYTTVIRDNNSKNQTFDSSTKIDTKEEVASNKEKESQVSDSFTEDLKKKT